MIWVDDYLKRYSVNFGQKLPEKKRPILTRTCRRESGDRIRLLMFPVSCENRMHPITELFNLAYCFYLPFDFRYLLSAFGSYFSIWVYEPYSYVILTIDYSYFSTCLYSCFNIENVWFSWPSLRCQSIIHLLIIVSLQWTHTVRWTGAQISRAILST